MLQVEELSVRYGHAQALSDVSLSISQGEVVAVVGRNGAGKTTLLRAITGLTSAVSGRVRLRDEVITGLPGHAIMRKGVAHIPQGRQIFSDQTVEDNLILGAYKDYWAHRTVVKARLKEQYQLFPRLHERRHQLAGTLSGGEQQMLAIARAAMSDPDVLLMDEPSMGLAPIFVKDVLDSVMELKRRGKTVLLVEQLAHAALAVSDRAYILQTGSVVTEGLSSDLLHDSSLLRTYLGG